MSITEVELIETEHKTKRKFVHTGTLRLENSLFNVDNQNGFDVLKLLCEKVDCNFFEVLDTINRTVR